MSRGNSLSDELSLMHISGPTRLLSISYAVFCLKKKNTYALKRYDVFMAVQYTLYHEVSLGPGVAAAANLIVSRWAAGAMSFARDSLEGSGCVPMCLCSLATTYHGKQR